MKRLWLAVGLLTAVIALCVASLHYQRHQINVLLTELDKLEASVTVSGAKQAVPLAKAFLKDYEQRTRLFPCFMSHNDLMGCHETAATLPATLVTQHTEEFFQEVSRFREQLKRLQEVEAPTLPNIL